MEGEQARKTGRQVGSEDGQSGRAGRQAGYVIMYGCHVWQVWNSCRVDMNMNMDMDILAYRVDQLVLLYTMGRVDWPYHIICLHVTIHTPSHTLMKRT